MKTSWAWLCCCSLLTAAASGQTLVREWEAPLGELRGTRIVDVAMIGPLLLVVDDRHGVTAVRPEDGVPVWFVQMDGPLDFIPSPGGGQLPLVSGARVLVVDGATGSRDFELALRMAVAAAPVSDGNRLYVPSVQGDRLAAVDLASGRTVWRLPLPGGIQGPALLAPGVGVLVASGDGRMRALPASLHRFEGEVWSADVGRLLGRPVLEDGRLFACTSDRGAVALRVGSGTLAWRYLPTATVIGGPLRVDDRVVIPTDAGPVALDAASGRPVWEGRPGEIPVGALDRAVLLRVARGASRIRSAADGTLLDLVLPRGLVAAGGRAIQRVSGTTLVGWRLVR